MAKSPAIRDQLGSAAEARLLDELQVHQVELEAQNDALRQTQTELEASEVRFRTVFDKAYTGMAVADLAGNLLEANISLAQILGYERDELIGSNIARFTHPDDLASELVHLEEIRVGQRDDYRMTKRYLSKSGGLLWVDLLVSVVRDAQGRALSLIGLVVDITERRRADADLRIAAAAFESQEGMMVTDPAGVILRVNLAFTRITGFAAEELVGRTTRMLHSARHSADFFRAMIETIRRTGGWQGELWERRKNGEDYPTWLTVTAVKDEGGKLTHYVSTHFDIAERKKAEARINELAYFDQLTGLPNRTLLLDRLTQAMTAGARSGAYAALLFIDLDNFKALNDSQGHEVGDLLLKQVAKRLSKSVRDGDTVARLGGDEFVVILADLPAGVREAAKASEAVAEKILATLNQIYRFGGAAHQSTASMGVVLFKGRSISLDNLMKHADLAMYKAKAAGRNTLRFFDPAMEIALKQRTVLENDLRRSVEAQKFLLHFQPQVVGAAAVMRLTGAEVLLRWQHPVHGMVSPADFIPLAEETGLILPLGQWVLETACAQLAHWARRPELAHLTLAVNVSARQFRQPDFVAQVISAVKNSGANPQRLKLELTESQLLHNVEEVIEKMFALKAIGVGFSLDDFGTGYSSLSYLKRLPLDQLKIDRSFVRDVLTDPNDAAIARTVVALAQNLGLGVIAEGVETAAQRDFLASSGCHAYQGYFFSRPLPLHAFEAFALGAASLSAALVAPGR